MASQAAVNLIVELQDKASKGLDGIAEKGGFLKNALSFAAGGAILGGVKAIGGAVTDFLGSALDEAKEAELGMAQLEAVLKSTGGAAGMTADDVLKLSQKLSASGGLSMFSADATLAANNMLLTFTEIGKDVFPMASQAAVDMATALGGDPVAQSVALGKALNDPIKGVTALRKVGVSFTKDQEAVIAAMVETGDVAGAQKIILAELAKEFGGSASKAAGTFAGKMATLAEKFDDVKEGIGNALMPALDSLATFAGAAMDAFSTGDFSKVGQLIIDTFNNVVNWIGSMIGPLTTAIGGWVRAFVDWIVPMIPQMLGQLAGLISQVVSWIISQAPVLVEAALGWGRAFIDWIVPLIFEWTGKAAEFIGAVVAWIISQGPALVEAVVGWSRAFIDWLATAIPEWLTKAGEFIGSVLAWIQTQLPILVSMVAGWATAFANWILDSIPGWLAAAGQFIEQVLAWLGGQIVPIAAQLQTWALAFVQWLTDTIPPLLVKLGELAMSIIGWLGTNLPLIVGKLGEWALAFIGWVLPILVPLLVELGKIAAGIGAWIITDALPGIVKMLAEWVLAFLNWVGEVLTGLAPKLGEIANAIWTWITTTASGIGVAIAQFTGAFWNWITEAIKNIPGKLGELAQQIWNWISQTAKDVYTKATEIGGQLIKGVWDGITGLLPAALEGARGAMQDLLLIMKQEAGVKSPSTVTDAMGQDIMQGLMDGMGAMAEAALNAIVAVMNSIISGAKQTLDVGSGASPLFATMGQNAMAGLQSGIDKNGNLPVTAMKTQVAKLLPAARDNLGDFKTIGAAISAGVNAGLNNTWGGVVNNVMGKARALAAQARAALDIASPSKPFVEIGQIIPDSITLGIEQRTPAMRDAMARSLSALDVSDPLAAMTAAWQQEFARMEDHLAATDPFEAMAVVWQANFKAIADNMAAQDPFEEMTKAWQEDFKNAADQLAASDPLEAMTALWQEEFNKLTNLVTPEMFAGLGDPFEAMTAAWQKEFADPTAASPIDALVTGIVEGGAVAEAEIVTQVSKLLPAAMASLGDFTLVGKAITAGITAGLEEGWGAVVQRLMDKVAALLAQAKAALDIHSPSGEFELIGRDMMRGWAIGIERGTDLLRSAVGSAIGAVTGGLVRPDRPGFGTMPVHMPTGGSWTGGEGQAGSRRGVGWSGDIVVHAGLGTDGAAVAQQIVDVLNEELGLDRRATSWVRPGVA